MTCVFFRNDDVALQQPGLQELNDIFISRGLPLSHAVEPANLTSEVCKWLLGLADRGIEIIQHGYAHAKHDRGEFGGKRSYADQLDDVRRGKEVMENNFGALFFPAFNFPFGPYNKYSMRVLDELGFKVVNSHYNPVLSRRIFYKVGHLLRRGRLFDRHVSYHLDIYPGTHLMEISVSLSPIKRYFGTYGSTECEFETIGDLQSQFLLCREYSPVIGVVLHHRYHGTPKRLEIINEFVDWLSIQPDVQFLSLEKIYERYKK